MNTHQIYSSLSPNNYLLKYSLKKSVLHSSLLKKIDNLGYFFKRFVPLLIYFVGTVSVASATGTYSCEFYGSTKVCPSSPNTYTAKYKTLPYGYTYNWSVSGDGATIGSTRKNAVHVNAGWTCDGKYKVTLKIKDKWGNTKATCYKWVWVGDKTPPVVYKGYIASCYKTQAEAEAAALAATKAHDNCSKWLEKKAYTTIYGCKAVIKVVVKDKCKNSSAVSYYTKIDGTAPVIAKGTIGTCYKTVDEARAAALAATTATDNCTATADLVESASTPGANTYCNATITVTVADACGNSASVDYYTRIDNTAPVFYNCPTGIVVRKTCDKDIYFPCDIYAVDNCDGKDVKLRYKIKELYSDCDRCDYGEDNEEGWQEGKWSDDRKFECFKVYLVVIKAKDKCGNVSKCKFKLIVKQGDDCKPICYKSGDIAACYKTVADAEAAAKANTTASSKCPGDLYESASTVIGNYCQATVTVTNKDKCGNSCTTVYYTRIDGTAPICYKGSIKDCYQTKEQAEAAAIAATSASDNCTPKDKLKFSAYTEGDCNAKITVTVTDECGNYCTSVYYTRIDNTPPVIYNCPDKVVVVNTCDKDIYFPCKIYAKDNCDGDDVKLRYKIRELYSDCDDKCDYGEDSEDGWQEGKWSDDRKFECFKVYLIVIKAKDKCGNVTKCKFKLIVKKRDDCTPIACGCSHGYWKNHTSNWPSCGSPSSLFRDIFGLTEQQMTDVGLPTTLTLNEAISSENQYTGQFGKVLRDGVAGLLNACGDQSKDCYKYSVTKVKEMVQKAIIDKNYSAGDDLESANTVGNCPYDNDKDITIASRGTNTGKPEVNATTSTISVKANPNPYTDRVRFVIQSPISGQATLDMFNLLGQKLQNVYRGHIQAGRTQTVDYNVPPSMRTNLVYKLHLGGREVTGQIIRR